MTEQELIERIDRLSGQQIVNMSDESLKRLTLDFKESFVRRVVAVGESLRDQEIILGRFDEALNNYNDSFIDGWPGWFNNGYESVSNIRFDLECGILIKNQPESVDFDKAMDDYMNRHTLTSEEIKELLLNADTVSFSTDNDNPPTSPEQRIKELEEENKKLEAENIRLNKQLQQRPQNEEPTVPVDEWFTGEYEEISADEEFTLRERLVFFSTVLSLENNKKYTVASNLETFIKELCNDQKNIGPLFSRMKKPENAAANAKAAKKVADLMKQIIPKEYRNDKHLPINKFIESMKLNFPETEED